MTNASSSPHPDRREFLHTGVKGLLATSLLATSARAAKVATGGSDKLGEILPTRPLSNTGESLTLLGMGGAHVGRLQPKEAQQLVEAGLEAGIRFFDNAHNYSGGLAEEYYGKYLCPKYRESVFLMTKSSATSAEDLRREFALSLKRLQTDYVDLLFIHSLFGPGDIDEREKNGVFDAIQALQASGKVRHIGFSTHTHAKTALEFLDRTKGKRFTCCGMTPINSVDAATPGNSFTRDVLPAMAEAGHSHFAMKTLSGGTLMGKPMKKGRRVPQKFPIPEAMSYEENYHFILSLPITSWVSGMETPAQLTQNAQLVKSFTRLSEDDKKNLIARVAAYPGLPLIEPYKKSSVPG